MYTVIEILLSSMQ